MELWTILFVVVLTVLIVGGFVALLTYPSGRLAPYLVPFGTTFGADSDHRTRADARV